MTTTISKVILSKRLSCPKSAKSLLADYCGSTLKGRTEGERRVTVCKGCLCYSTIFFTPQLLFAFLHARVPSTSTCALWQFSHQFTKLSLFFSKAASSHSLTLLSTLLYQLHNSSHGKMTNVLSKQNNYYIQLSNSPFFVCFVFPQVIFLSAKMFECLNRCLCLKYCTCAIEGDSQRWRLFLLFSHC